MNEEEKESAREYYRKCSNENGRVLRYHVLHYKVLVVASIDTHYNKWAAYCADVPGVQHDREFVAVAERGDKISEAEASVMFPEFTELYEWRM